MHFLTLCIFFFTVPSASEVAATTGTQQQQQLGTMQMPSQVTSATVDQPQIAMAIGSAAGSCPEGGVTQNTLQHYQVAQAGKDTIPPPSTMAAAADESVAAALKDIKMAIQATRVLQHQSTRIPPNPGASPTSTSATVNKAASNQQHATIIGGVAMNGSAISISKQPHANATGSVVTTNVIGASSQTSIPSSNVAVVDPVSSDPWVLRNNYASDAGTAGPVPSSTPVNENSNFVVPQHKISSARTVPNASIANTSTINSSNKALVTPTMVHAPHPPSALTIPPKPSAVANCAVISSATVTQQQANNNIIMQDSNKSPHRPTVIESIGGDKSNSSRRRVELMGNHDINIDEDVDDPDEDEEEDEEEDDDLEDEESESEIGEERVPTPKNTKDGADDDLDPAQETDRLIGQQYNDDNGYYDSKVGSQIFFLCFACVIGT